MSPANAKFKKSISLLLILNLGVWIVAGSKLENPDWNMWIDTDDGQLSNKRITAKSVFIAPPISKCPEGHRVDQAGHCVKIATVNHANQWQFYLDKLNLMFAKKPESNAVVAGSEPFKLNIPIFNNIPIVEDTHKINTTVNTTTESSTQRHEVTTRKQPHFTNLFNMQTTFTTNGKTEVPSTTGNSVNTQTPESTTKTEAWSQSTKQLPESTTTMPNDKFETVMWITEKPKREQTDSTAVDKNPTHETNTPSLPSTIEMNNYTTQDSRENSTTPLFTAQTPPLFEKLGTTVDVNPETVYPSSPPPPPTLFDITRTTFIPTSHSEQYPGDTATPLRPSTSQPQPNNNHVSTSTTTDSPFLIIVTDTNNHIVNTNENEPSDTDYILISNSSLAHVNNSDDVNNSNKSQHKIVDKRCIDTEVCNDEIVLPYFESTKTIRNNNPKVVQNTLNQTNNTNKTSSPDSGDKLVENNKPENGVDSKLMDMKHKEPGPSEQAPNTGADKLNASSLNDKLSLDSTHIYESLKMPPSSPSKVEPNQSSAKKKPESTTQNLLHIVHPTPPHYSATPVYSPAKKSAPPTTQRSPTLTTTKRIFTHSQPKPYTDNTNVYNLMYSIQPANVDYGSNSNEYLFGSSSSYMEPQYGSYDTSSYIRFPSEQQPPPAYSLKQHPNSKFSLDFQNTFGGDQPPADQGANSFIRFPSISRTPASTFNSNRYSNTRWPPHQPPQTDNSGQYDHAWNSRWPPHQQQQQAPSQQYYNQNSRYQQNVPIANYKLLQL